MSSFNILLRILTLFLHFLRFIYWFSTEKKANREKPAKYADSTKGQFKRLVFSALSILLFIQLLGLNILPFPHNALIQIIGLLLTIIGISVSILGRRDLGSNWEHGAHYQIKKNQELVTTGIYVYIRHPIYVGLMLAFVGGELVAQSYLALFFFVISLFGMYYQGKKEEELLIQHFGKGYTEYMKKTKMFIPYMF